jgi:hypothetical protein
MSILDDNQQPLDEDESELLGALAEMLVNSGDLDPEVLELWSDTDES